MAAVAFNKPYGVLSQFTPEPGSLWRTLAEYSFPKGLYPVGRLDADSEGLLILSDEPALVAELLDPERGHPREYWVQVEGIPSAAALARLAAGGRHVRPCRAWLLAEARLRDTPPLPPRDPPIRVRKSIPDTWIALELTEGKNRQVRRMTAAVGHPTLRLFRARIGALTLAALALKPGKWRALSASEQSALLNTPP